MGRASWVELAKRLRWEAEGLVDVSLTRTSARHPWTAVRSLTLTRGRWDVMDLDVSSPWFDMVPLHVVAELASGRAIRRRLDRDRLLRFGQRVAGVDPEVGSRPVTRAFLEELGPMLGWSSIPGGGGAPLPSDDGVGDDGSWEMPDPDLL